MTRIRAAVRNLSGNAVHLRGWPTSDGIEAVELPNPVTVEVVEKEGACYLFRLDGDGNVIADTWHKTLEEAQEQARFEFCIEKGDWESVEG